MEEDESEEVCESCEDEDGEETPKPKRRRSKKVTPPEDLAENVESHECETDCCNSEEYQEENHETVCETHQE